VERPDPGTAELTDPQPLDQPVLAAPRPPRRRRALNVLLGLVLCGLVAGSVVTVLDDRSADDRVDARRAALQAARQQAVNLTTISYETADRDLARIIAASTGTLKTQFETQAKSFPAVLRREKSVSEGRVLAAGVKSQDGKVVDALIAVDATVRNSASGDAGVVKHYRMDMRLVLIGSRWLVSTVAFAGLPQ
jgi:Mce-associated membrane protein